jgi:hypothetical protein
VGGLMFSQFVTLFLTPVFYIYMEDANQWVARLLTKRKRRKAEREAVPSHHGPMSPGPVSAPMARISVKPRD